MPYIMLYVNAVHKGTPLLEVQIHVRKIINLIFCEFLDSY